MKITYNLGNGKIKELSNSNFDQDNNKLIIQKLSSSAVSLNLSDGIIFSDNGILSSSFGLEGQILSWDNINNKWSFRNLDKISADSALIPSNSDITGSSLSNAQVKSISNITTGTLPVMVGGTGLTTSDFNYYGEALLVGNGTNKLVLKPSSDDSTRPAILAQFTASTAIDDSYDKNKITLIKGQIGDAPTAIFGSTKVLSSSYDANTANYTGYIEFLDGHSGDFTIECWSYLLNTGNSPAANGRSYIYVDNAFNSAIGISGNSVDATGKYTIYDGSGVTDTLNFIPNQWVHLAMVRKNNKLKLYVNATGSVEVSAATVSPFSSIFIGTNSNGQYNMNGYITDFCFTKYAKSASEIITYYNAVKAGSKERHTKDEINISATSKLEALLTINDSNGQKINMVQGYLGPLVSSTLFNYYY